MKPLLALVAFLFLPLPASASDRLFLAGPDGVVYEANLRAHSFEERMRFPPDVTAMAADRRHLYVASRSQIHVIDLVTDRLVRSLLPGPSLGDVISMATLGNELYAGSNTGRVARVDVETGQLSALRILPPNSELDQVRGLAVDEEHLFVASYLGFVFRAPREGGGFENLGRGLGFNAMQEIARHGEDLLVGESVGYVGRLDPNTGEVLSSMRTDGVAHMVVHGDRLLICSAYFDRISALSLRSGSQARTTHDIPFHVDAMVVARDRRGDLTLR